MLAMLWNIWNRSKTVHVREGWFTQSAEKHCLKEYSYVFCPSNSSYVEWREKVTRGAAIKLQTSLVYVAQPYLDGIDVTERRNLVYNFRWVWSDLVGCPISGTVTNSRLLGPDGKQHACPKHRYLLSCHTTSLALLCPRQSEIISCIYVPCNHAGNEPPFEANTVLIQYGGKIEKNRVELSTTTLGLFVYTILLSFPVLLTTCHILVIRPSHCLRGCR